MDSFDVLAVSFEASPTEVSVGIFDSSELVLHAKSESINTRQKTIIINLRLLSEIHFSFGIYLSQKEIFSESCYRVF